MKDTLVTILFKTRSLEPKVSYSILLTMVSLPWFIFLLPFLSSFKKFCKPTIILKSLIGYQMRKSLCALTAKSMPYFEIYITGSVSLQSPLLTRPLEETSSRNHLRYVAHLCILMMTNTLNSQVWINYSKAVFLDCVHC